MPGKKEMCQLSALVQPEKYADILLQKVRTSTERKRIHMVESILLLPLLDDDPCLLFIALSQ